jgi:hypothetical protein
VDVHKLSALYLNLPGQNHHLLKKSGAFLVMVCNSALLAVFSGISFVIMPVFYRSSGLLSRWNSISNPFWNKQHLTFRSGSPPNKNALGWGVRFR